MTRLLSDALTEDLKAGEVSPPTRLIVHNGTAWAVVAVNKPTAPDDQYRAYVCQNYMQTCGLIAISSATESDLLDAVKNWLVSTR